VSAAPDSILQAVQGMLCESHGVTDITTTMDDKDPTLLTVKFTGWGPTLHRRRFTLGVDLSETLLADGASDLDVPVEDGPFDADQEGVVHHVSYALMDQAQGQRTLSRIGMELGLHEPMLRPGDPSDPETSGSSIGHIEVDEAMLAALLGAMTPGDAMIHLVDAVSDTIGGDEDEMDQDVHGGSDPAPTTISYPCATADEEYVTIRHLHEEGRPRCAMSMSRNMRGEGGETSATVVDGYVRFEPEVLQTVADTLAAGLVGKPLSMLVDTGCPQLDAMTIQDIKNGEDGLDVKLRSGRVRLSDHPLIGPLVTVPGETA
jgi:hypothetical protein